MKKGRRTRFMKAAAAAAVISLAAAAANGAAAEEAFILEENEDSPVIELQEQDLIQEQGVIQYQEQEQYDPGQEEAYSNTDVTVNIGTDDLGSILIDMDSDDDDLTMVTDGITLEEALEQEEKDEVTARAESFIEDNSIVLPVADPQWLEQVYLELSSMPSPTGSDGELLVGQYIMDMMADMGYKVSVQHFHEGFLNDDLIDLPGMNILAEKEVDVDPEKATDDILLVITHYDSREDPEEDDPLANDKTGAAVLMETARLLAEIETDTDVCFVFLSGEEDGYFGSASFLETIKDFTGRICGVICIGPCGYVPAAKEQTDGAETETESAEEMTEDPVISSEGQTEQEKGIRIETQQSVSGVIGNEAAAGSADVAAGSDQQSAEEMLPDYFVYTMDTPAGAENIPSVRLQTAAAVQKLYKVSELEDMLIASGGPEENGQAGGLVDGMAAQQEDAVYSQGVDSEGYEVFRAETAGTEGETETYEQKLGKLNVLNWDIAEDRGSSCSVFADAGLNTVWVHQLLPGMKLPVPAGDEDHAAEGEETADAHISAGQDAPASQESAAQETEDSSAESGETAEADDRVPDAGMTADPYAMAEAADVLARAVGMYMTGEEVVLR